MLVVVLLLCKQSIFISLLGLVKYVYDEVLYGSTFVTPYPGWRCRWILSIHLLWSVYNLISCVTRILISSPPRGILRREISDQGGWAALYFYLGRVSRAVCANVLHREWIRQKQVDPVPKSVIPQTVNYDSSYYSFYAGGQMQLIQVCMLLGAQCMPVTRRVGSGVQGGNRNGQRESGVKGYVSRHAMIH